MKTASKYFLIFLCFILAAISGGLYAIYSVNKVDINESAIPQINIKVDNNSTQAGEYITGYINIYCNNEINNLLQKKYILGVESASDFQMREINKNKYELSYEFKVKSDEPTTLSMSINTGAIKTVDNKYSNISNIVELHFN